MIKYSSLLILLISMLVVPVVSRGGGTKIWEIAGFIDLDKGEQDGTRVSSLGEVSLGNSVLKRDLEGVGLVWSAVRDSHGGVYLGTGYDGKIFRFKKGKLEEIVSTGQLVVTTMAMDKKGDLYIGTLPDATIWKVASPGKINAGKPQKAQKWATLPEGTEHVWALAFDPDGGTLYAGTGPEGKLFAIGRDAKPKVYLDSEEEHILSLAVRKKGALLVGTSPKALLLEVTGPGRTTSLVDFNATEVKAIASAGDEFFVAVNTFKRPPAVPNSSGKSAAKSGTGTSASAKKSTRNLGDGKLYRFSARGQMEKIWEKNKSHIVSVAATKKGKVFAGLGVDGKVISVSRDRVHHTEIDVDERQVMALIAGKDLEFVATGDAGAAYSVSKSRAAVAVYLTPPLDAKTVSNWGRLRWFSRGKLKVQSRSGNTVKPDTSWSDWSKEIPMDALVPSPSARYIQLRFSWAQDDKAVLVSAELAYRCLNRRAVITEFDPDSPYPKSKKITKKDQGKTSTRTIAAVPTDKNDFELNLTWKVNNPDKDRLRYRLWYRKMGKELWRPIIREDRVYTSMRYAWDTMAVPHGRYQIKLVADDSPSNDSREVLKDEFVSVPILIDNHQPEVSGLVFDKGSIRGMAQDGFSEISGIEYAVDTGPWMPVFSKDGVFDETKEEFEFPLPSHCAKGPHAVAIRAVDRAGNRGINEIHILVK